MKIQNKIIALIILTFFLVGTIQETNAVTGRSPTGVNINTNGVSSVLITFQNLEPNEVSVDAFWCGEVTATGVVVGTNPCVPGTLFGHLPKQFDLSRISDGVTSTIPGTDLPPVNKSAKSSAAPRNLTDVMSIPTAVIRRAYQESKRGASSQFFYVRQFVNNGVNTYVTVTCRMGAGGARTPLSLTKVKVDFTGDGYRQAITLVKPDTNLSKLEAKIDYTGSGLIKGRWEIVLPGDVEPTSFDLLSEASLPPADRVLQKRYRLLSRFQKFLPPSGKATIKGPDPKLLPTIEKGMYRILFRVEASNDIESRSDTTDGILNAGGVAGFPMPTLRYFVGEKEQLKETKSYPPISLLLPQNKQSLSAKDINFSWFDLQDNSDVAIYKIEFYEKNGEQKLLSSVFKKPGDSNYKPSKEILKKFNQPILWRVVAIEKNGKTLSTSQLRELTLQPLAEHFNDEKYE